jgi:thymidine kinase
MTPARLEVICGPMFSGKTTELMRRLVVASGRGPVMAFKPRRDDRYHASAIATHTGQTYPAQAVDTAAEIELACGRAAVVGIDEAHFFGAGLMPVCLSLLARGTSLIIAGIERDHRGRPFEPFPSLLCEADDVIKLSGPCARCGAPALHSQRLVASEDAIVVGGAEAYEARCRACFRPPA